MSPASYQTAPPRDVSPKYRAGNGTRTRDPNLGKVVLYQLSYSRVRTPKVPVCAHPSGNQNRRESRESSRRQDAGNPFDAGASLFPTTPTLGATPLMEARGIEPLTS